MLRGSDVDRRVFAVAALAAATRKADLLKHALRLAMIGVGQCDDLRETQLRESIFEECSGCR